VIPKIIILYGPPNSGKGTQSFFLKEKLSSYYHLDFGSELRSFVKENIGDFHINEEHINPDISPKILEISRRIRDRMKNNLPVETPDLRFVIEKTITDCVERDQGMIIEGPGRLVEEAKWLSGFMGQKELSVAIFHLYASLEEVLERSGTRYYIPSTKKPFTSYEEAKSACQENEEPYRRPEDEDRECTKQRYRMLYADNFAKIISIYQKQAKSMVLTVDASQEIEDVSKDILDYFKIFYNENI
jgi:adenylate kinase family enzyme